MGCSRTRPAPQLCNMPNLLLLRLRKEIVTTYLSLAAAFAWLQLRQLQVRGVVGLHWA